MRTDYAQLRVNPPDLETLKQVMREIIAPRFSGRSRRELAGRILKLLDIPVKDARTATQVDEILQDKSLPDFRTWRKMPYQYVRNRFWQGLGSLCSRWWQKIAPK